MDNRIDTVIKIHNGSGNRILVYDSSGNKLDAYTGPYDEKHQRKVLDAAPATATFWHRNNGEAVITDREKW